MDVLDCIYDAIIDDAAYAVLPQFLATATASRSSILLELDDRMVPTSSTYNFFTPEIHQFYMTGGMHEHDLWSHTTARVKRFDVVTMLDDYIDIEDYRRSTFYNELYRPFGDDTGRSMGVLLRRDQGFMAVAMHRAISDRRFEAPQAAALQQLLPHLRRLSAMRARMAQSRRHQIWLTEALDALSFALFITDARGVVRTSNAAAETLLRAQDVVRLRHGKLIPADVRLEEAFHYRIKTAALKTGNRGGAMHLSKRLLYEDDGVSVPIAVLIAPLSGSSGGALVLMDADPMAPSDMGVILRQLYGLTPAETELAIMLDQGLSPAEAAQRKNVSIATVRTQIRRLMDKMQAQSTTDIVRILTRIPRLRS